MEQHDFSYAILDKLEILINNDKKNFKSADFCVMFASAETRWRDMVYTITCIRHLTVDFLWRAYYNTKKI